MCVSVWAFSETAFDIDHSQAESCALIVIEPWVIPGTSPGTSQITGVPYLPSSHPKEGNVLV